MCDLWGMDIFQRSFQQHGLCGLLVPRLRQFFQLGIQILFQCDAGFLAPHDFFSCQPHQRGNVRTGPPIIEGNSVLDRHLLAGRDTVLVCVQIIKAILIRHGLNPSYLAGVSGPFFVLGCQPF